MSAPEVPTPRVSVVVPCRNEAAHIERFLQGLEALDCPPGGLEILVADGRSTDGTRAVIEAHAAADPRIVLVDNPQQVVPAGLNAAIRAARGEIVLRMDVHTDYARDYVVESLRVLEATGADNVGGPARTRAAGIFQEANAVAYASPFAVGGARFHDPAYEGEVDTVPYGCWRRERLLEAGLFDEQFVRNQDDELNLRLRRQGGRIWQSPAIRSWYWPRSTAGGLFRQYFQYGYWKVPVIRKHRVPASWRHLVPGLAILAAVGLAVTGWFLPGAWAVLGLLCTAYGLLALAFTVHACVRADTRWSLLPVLPVVFALYHLAYGAGFLVGLWDFRRGGRRPRQAMEQLTR